MKNIILFLASSFIFIHFNFGQTSVLESEVGNGSADLTVHLTNLKSDEGQLMVGLYNDSGQWLKKIFDGKETKIIDGEATVVFENVPEGKYAISAFHDEDGDGELKSGVFGIPKEPYASSRGAKGRFGPPKWVDAVFEISKENLTETIKF